MKSMNNVPPRTMMILQYLFVVSQKHIGLEFTWLTHKFCFVSEELGRKLEEYIARLPVSTRVIRSEERTGLIRARLKGQGKGAELSFIQNVCQSVKCCSTSSAFLECISNYELNKEKSIGNVCTDLLLILSVSLKKENFVINIE